MILLDTHVWVWWCNSPKSISSAALALMESADDLAVSVISCWELAMAIDKVRLKLDRPVLDWIDDSTVLRSVRVVEMSPAIAVTAAQLGRRMHGDPADRIIVATAMEHHATLISKDKSIHRAAMVPVVW